MNVSKLKLLFSEFGDNVSFEVNLKKKNWFNIGGKTKVFYKAENLKELISFLKKNNNKNKIFVLGAGSNTLISDNLFDGIIIKLSKDFKNISLNQNDILIAGCAVLDRSVSEFAVKNSLSGFEFLSCIPGTIGGGIMMNAGCFDKEFKDILISVQAIDKTGNIKTIHAKNIKFGYRETNLPRDLIFLSASFQGSKGNSEKIKKKIEELKLRKIKNQPHHIKTSGSTFKNPIYQTKKKVWQLIRQSVDIDKNFGDAYISSKHSNFFVNKGNATYEDMINLINYVEENVFKKTGIKLQKEIRILE